MKEDINLFGKIWESEYTSVSKHTACMALECNHCNQNY